MARCVFTFRWSFPKKPQRNFSIHLKNMAAGDSNSSNLKLLNQFNVDKCSFYERICVWNTFFSYLQVPICFKIPKTARNWMINGINHLSVFKLWVDPEYRIMDIAKFLLFHHAIDWVPFIWKHFIYHIIFGIDFRLHSTFSITLI